MEFAQTLDGGVPYSIRGVLSAAVDGAARDAVAARLDEPVVLLSPACASFDQYPKFEERGTVFTDVVLAIPGVTATVNAS
jgi:UDP-N-acetylmuramoylalanine--D-glutamate ligase